MCGRFTLTDVNYAHLVETFDLGPAGPAAAPPTLVPRYNIAPTQPVATVIRDPAGHNRLEVMLWGLIPHWAKDRTGQAKMINARGETVHEKPSFRDAFKRRRCLIVADGFYEWQPQAGATNQPMYITLKSRAPFGMAWLWSRWTDPETGEVPTTCPILTTTPNTLMEAIHNRMPVILPREQYAAWLDPAAVDPEILLPLIRPFDARLMTAYPVSPRVNRPTNDDPGLIERAG